ncbi:unnamed protein product [Victoria cruziana]
MSVVLLCSNLYLNAFDFYHVSSVCTKMYTSHSGSRCSKNLSASDSGSSISFIADERNTLSGYSRQFASAKSSASS